MNIEWQKWELLKLLTDIKLAVFEIIFLTVGVRKYGKNTTIVWMFPWECIIPKNYTI